MPGGQLSIGQQDSLAAANQAVGGASLAASLLLVAVLASRRDLRGARGNQMVAAMGLANAALGGALLAGAPRDGSAACTAQAFVYQWAALASVAWTTVIAYTLHRAVLAQALMLPRALACHAFAWLVPLALALLPLSTDSYGNAGTGQCWLSINPERVDPDAAQLWRYASFFGPLWLGMLVDVWVLWRVAQVIRGSALAVQAAGLLRLRLYPLVAVLCWAAPTANRLENLLEPSSVHYWLVLLQNVSQAALGVLVSGIFMWGVCRGSSAAGVVEKSAPLL